LMSGREPPGSAERADLTPALTGDPEVRRASLARDLGDVAQLLSLGEALQLLERLVLDLANALARDVEGTTHLVQRARMLAAEAIAELEHAPLAIGEVLQRLTQRFLGQDLGGTLIRGLRALVGDELPELG